MFYLSNYVSVPFPSFKINVNHFVYARLLLRPSTKCLAATQEGVFAGLKPLLSGIWNFCPSSETCSITFVHFFCFYQDIKFDVFGTGRNRIDKCVRMNVYSFFFLDVTLPHWLIGYPGFVATYYQRKGSQCPRRIPGVFLPLNMRTLRCL